MQGTADLIVDQCEDYWDGKDLRPMSVAERKLILDFYQRTSLTAICTAFSYKPFTYRMSSTIESKYLEWPPSRTFLPSYRLANVRELSSPKETNTTLLLSNLKESSVSTDCLFPEGIKDHGEVTEIQTLPGCMRSQSGQVFIGMVSMQYHACDDMVSF